MAIGHAKELVMIYQSQSILKDYENVDTEVFSLDEVGLIVQAPLQRLCRSPRLRDPVSCHHCDESSKLDAVLTFQGMKELLACCSQYYNEATHFKLRNVCLGYGICILHRFMAVCQIEFKTKPRDATVIIDDNTTKSIFLPICTTKRHL